MLPGLPAGILDDHRASANHLVDAIVHQSVEAAVREEMVGGMLGHLVAPPSRSPATVCSRTSVTSSHTSMVAEHDVTVFGAGAGYLLACAKEDLHPGKEYPLDALRAVGSTGSPLPASGFRWCRTVSAARSRWCRSAGAQTW